MNKISFKKTNNILLDAGIVGLFIYLEKFKQEHASTDLTYQLTEDILEIESPDLYNVLENVYYLMGKDIYDTSGKKARENQSKYYFVKEPSFAAKPFYKMKTYGLGELITNDPTPVAGRNGSKKKFEKLVNEDYDFALNIAREIEKHNGVLKHYSLKNGSLVENPKDSKGKRISNQGGESEIYINDAYTKTTALGGYDKKYFTEGDKVCYLTGESFQKLVDTQNTSPFLSGLLSFDSYGKGNTRKISWKAMYLSRFSPVLTLYMYIDRRNSMVCFVLVSDNLKALYQLYRDHHRIFLTEKEKEFHNYVSNFKLINLNEGSKGKENSYTQEFKWEPELLFMLIYTKYREFFFDTFQEDSQGTEEDLDKYLKEKDLLIEFERKKIAFASIRADKMVSKKSMRPNHFEVFTNYKYILRLFYHLQKNGVRLDYLIYDTKFLKRSDRSSKKSYLLERKLRSDILNKFLHLKPLIKEFHWLFYNAFLYLTGRDEKRSRHYNNLANFLVLYEPLTDYGGNRNMNKEIQERAINLGKQIGQGILLFDNAQTDIEKKANIKKGKKYIISLNKARTMSQYLDEIIRIMTRYQISMSGELQKWIDEENWEYIKQFSIISALSNLNYQLNPTLKKENNN